MPVLVTRLERFNAGHRLYRPELSDEENRRIFGKCSNPAGHGHNYVLEVSVEGHIDPQTGYLFDLGALSELIHDQILADVDHANLNVDVDWMKGLNPTAEVLASTFWDRLEPHLPGGMLYRVKVQETEKNWAERRRDP